MPLGPTRKKEEGCEINNFKQRRKDNEIRIEVDGREYVMGKVSINSDNKICKTRSAFLARKWNEFAKQWPTYGKDLRRLQEEVDMEDETMKIAEEPNDVSRDTCEGNEKSSGSLHHSVERRCLGNLPSIIEVKPECFACHVQTGSDMFHFSLLL